jgi:dolichyl-phosphate-mannose--protein O-mannosyl transferase
VSCVETRKEIRKNVVVTSSIKRLLESNLLFFVNVGEMAINFCKKNRNSVEKISLSQLNILMISRLHSTKWLTLFCACFLMISECVYFCLSLMSDRQTELKYS